MGGGQAKTYQGFFRSLILNRKVEKHLVLKRRHINAKSPRSLMISTFFYQNKDLIPQQGSCLRFMMSVFSFGK